MMDVTMHLDRPPEIRSGPHSEDGGGYVSLQSIEGNETHLHFVNLHDMLEMGEQIAARARELLADEDSSYQKYRRHVEQTSEAPF